MPQTKSTNGDIVKKSRIAGYTAALMLAVGTLSACGSTNEPPASCLLALNLADQGFSFASDGFQAVADTDIAALTTATDKIHNLAPQYQAAKAECRGSAG